MANNMDFYTRLVSRGWFRRIHSEFSEDEILNLRAKYFKQDATKDFKPRSHIALCVRAKALAESVFVLGGTKKDIHKALEYLIICLDCEKYRLDYRKYRKDNNIRDLEKKYSIYT